MRILRVVFAIMLLVGLMAVQAPTPRAAQAAPKAGPAAPKAAGVPKAAAKVPAIGFEKPYGTLAQVMRGINFPNSNIVFDVQSDDPAKQKPDLKKVYAGWQTVEYAAVAMQEASNLLLIPGRKCENGNTAPVAQADYRGWAQGLVDAAGKVLVAAKTRNIDKVVDATDDLSDACANCHMKYRDVKDRCTP
jgi:hypothetical protein